MSADDCHCWTDSTYELISDGESQDGHGTESILSVESPKADDVCSIPGTDHAYDDDEKAGHEEDEEDEEDDDEDEDDDDIEEHQLSGSEHLSRQSSSIEYANHALRTPSPHSGDSSSQSLQSVPSLGLSIEFSEMNDARCAGSTSVKHTIRTLSEDESARVARSMGMEGGPKSLIVTIRQTMCADYLSTNGPLRILYVGSESAYHDIIYKLSSAITASTYTANQSGPTSSHTSDRTYNIVPVSAFGSSSIPDVELMETSAFQIKAVNCTAAQESPTADGNISHVYPDNSGYTLTINEDRSVCLPLSPQAPDQPDWELPHVAVFYCTDKDDELAKQTRDAAWGAMVSRGVPCLFISHNLNCEDPLPGRWRGYLDPDTLHVSVESSTPTESVMAERLPVDLNSFLTIDARQMNRNLAYITGLHGTKVGARKDVDRKTPPSSVGEAKPLRLRLSSLAEAPNWSVLFARLTLAMILIGVGCFVGGYLSLRSSPRQDIGSGLTNAIPTSQSSPQIPITTATVTVERTSTRTVEVPRADSSSVPWFFDGVIWPMPGRPVFTASKGANAVLLKIDADYSHFVIPGRVRVTVHRGPEPIMAQITVHNGQAVLVEFERQDAHGVLTVRVETTQKPKVYETYEIDFGRPLGLFDMPFSYVHSFALNLAAAANETVRSVPQSYGSGIQALSEAVFDQAASRSSSLFQQLKDARGYTAVLAERAKNDAKISLTQAGQKLASRLPTPETAQKKADLALRKAQISSKLWWLKMQGKMQEYEMYEQKAVKFLEEKMEQLSQTAKGQQTRSRPGVFSFLKPQW